MHLAVFNIARLRAPMDDPLIDDFRNNLDPINALAEGSPGFVWRLQDESGNATNITPYGDPLVITNMAVWTSIDALADFTYRSGHLEFLRRRRDFFEAPSEAILVLWWIPEGTIPTMEEAMARLEHLRAHGPTPTRSPSATASSPATTRRNAGQRPRHLPRLSTRASRPSVNRPGRRAAAASRSVGHALAGLQERLEVAEDPGVAAAAAVEVVGCRP